MNSAALVVIVEDEAVLRDLLAQKLSAEGFRVETAGDGEAGLALIKKSQPDLVLLDLAMPKMSGLEVLDALKEDAECASIPVVVISNSGEGFEVQDVLRRGARDVLVKTDLTPNEVLKKVKRVLEKQPTVKRRRPAPVKNISAHRTAKQESHSLASSRQAVLIIEDDPFLGDALKLRLEREGISVTLCRTGREGLAALRLQIPPLIVVDVLLPDADGFQLLQKIQKRPRASSSHFLLLSNVEQESHRERVQSMDRTDYAVKANLTTEEIVKKMKDALAARPS